MVWVEGFEPPMIESKSIVLNLLTIPNHINVIVFLFTVIIYIYKKKKEVGPGEGPMVK